MNRKHLALLALATAGTLAAGAANARNPADVQWSVTIGSPQIGVVVGSPTYPAYPARVYTPPVVVAPAYPVYGTPYGRPVYRTAWHDADRDGIPDRYDRVYNPRWDRDGDGIPNRYDRHPNRRGR